MPETEAAWTSVSDELKRLQTKSTKVTDESVSKTRQMLHLVNECKDAGLGTMQELSSQGAQLTRTEEALNDTSERLDRAHIRIRNIERANNVPCCCVCCVSLFQKDPDRIKTKQDKNKNENLQAKKGEENVHGGGSVSTVLPPRDINGGGDVNKGDSRFFPKILGTQAEEVIEQNLTQVSEHLTDLKGIALGMNDEVSKQNEQIDRMNDKAEKSLVKVNDATKRTTDLVNDKGNTRKCCSIL